MFVGLRGFLILDMCEAVYIDITAAVPVGHHRKCPGASAVAVIDH